MSTLKTIRTASGKQAAIVFIHGFGGDSRETWQNFPQHLADDSRLSDWDIYSLGYNTHLRVDVVKLWAADPDLQEVAGKLSTDVQVGAIRRYKSLALIAHSMGGLVTQRAMLDSADLRNKTSHVFLFGTPSDGLRKASFVRWLKPQLRDMSRDGVFIRRLRKDWDTRFSKLQGRSLPFVFSVVGGSEDEFVPYESSLGPFSEEAYPGCRFMVPGNHLEIVKPISSESESVQLVVNRLIGNAPSTEVWNSARVAIESRDFQRAVDLLEARANELDKEGVVQLALGLEGVGRQNDAISLLQQRDSSETDLMGVLAGRLKRRWLLNRIEKDGATARQLYGKALECALTQQDYSQAFYHGINVAFFQLFADRQLTTAQATARDVLEYCQKAQAEELSSNRKWRLATEGEALIHLNQPDAAYLRYQQAIAPEYGAEPREIESMYQQAIYLSREVGDNAMRRALTKLFRNEGSK